MTHHRVAVLDTLHELSEEALGVERLGVLALLEPAAVEYVAAPAELRHQHRCNTTVRDLIRDMPHEMVTDQHFNSVRQFVVHGLPVLSSEMKSSALTTFLWSRRMWMRPSSHACRIQELHGGTSALIEVDRSKN